MFHGLQPSRLLCPWDFSRQDYWSELSFSLPGDLPDPEIEPTTPALAGRFIATEPLEKPDEVNTSVLLSMKRCCVFNGTCFRSSRLIFKD